MIGRELLAALRALPDRQLDFEVETEGCDCIGDVEKVEVRREKRYGTDYRSRSEKISFIALRRTGGDVYDDDNLC